MDAIKHALQERLEETIERLKGLGGELAFEVRGRLVERANRLAEALDRLRFGEYGTCRICGESIAAGRLRAIPEVTTCVACQDAEERRGRRGGGGGGWRRGAGAGAAPRARGARGPRGRSARPRAPSTRAPAAP